MSSWKIDNSEEPSFSGIDCGEVDSTDAAILVSPLAPIAVATRVPQLPMVRFLRRMYTSTAGLDFS